MAAADSITNFHAHIYFDPDAADRAAALGTEASSRFGLAMGRVHRQPVGPHPRGSCQLTVPREAFGEVAQWLALHRGDFTIFAHANTGDDLADHTAHVIWFGPSETLRLEMFERARHAPPAGTEMQSGR
jgi:aromatic ring-cleaving dioxygenase